MEPLLRNGLLPLAALVFLASFALGDGYGLLAQLAALMIGCAGVIARDARQGTLLTALACLGLNAYLFQRKIDFASGPSLCNVSDVINCDRVNMSEWSMAFGVPITLFGMAFYAGLALAVLLAGKKQAEVDRISGWFALATIPYSLFLAYISKTIGAFCVVCISIYVGNFLLLWASVRSLRQQGAGLFDGISETLRSNALITIVIVFVAGLIGGQSWFQNATRLPSVPKPEAPGVVADPGKADPAAPPADPLAMFAELYSLPGGNVALSGTEARLGPADARYTVLEYADFGCPHCAMAAQELKELLAAQSDVALLFRPFPLSAACNPLIKQYDPSENPDPSRCYAAWAADCAGKQGKYFDMSSEIFARQSDPGTFAPDGLAFLAKKLELDLPKWEQCMASPETHARIVADAQAGNDAGVEGTPTFFVKGVFGDTWIQVTRGVPALLAILEAHRDGAALPSPQPAAPTPQ